MDFDTLWLVADRARRRSRLAPEDVSFVRDVAPEQLDSFPRLKLPTSVRHPAGFSISGASVGTFVRSALLVAGQKALGKRFGGSEFYERVERDLAFSHHAISFSPWLSKGRPLLHPVHAGRDSGTGSRRHPLFRLSRVVQIRRAPGSDTPMAVRQTSRSTNGALGIG
jgi:hypothetical protein